MKDKKKLYIIIGIIVLVIAGLIAGLLIINSKDSNNNNNNNKTKETETHNEIDENGVDCTTKGNLCTIFQIGDGIKRTIKINSGSSETFHMISNTEDKMAFISDKTFDEITYSDDEYNFFGPINLLEQTYNRTKDWNMVEPLKFEYEDKGKNLYYETCPTFETEVQDYMCNVGKNGIGFKYVKYDNGITYEDGFGNVETIGSGDIYARPATLEEFENLLLYGQEVKWLSHTDDFWLMDSDSQMVSGIIHGAKYIYPSDESSYGYYINPDDISNKHGYKVVIEISKN